MIEQDRKRSRQWNRRIHKGRNMPFCIWKTECPDQLIAKAQVRRRSTEAIYYKFCTCEGLCSGQVHDAKLATIDLRQKK